MPETQVFLSTPTLCGLPWTVAFPLVKDLGFDGLEILLTRRVIASWRRFYALEREYGLALTFHRWWRGKEVSARILGGLRIFPADGVRISHVLPNDFPWPVVVSTYNWEERFDLPTHCTMIQPACTGYDDPKNIMPFEDMRQALQTYGKSIRSSSSKTSGGPCGSRNSFGACPRSRARYSPHKHQPDRFCTKAVFKSFKIFKKTPHQTSNSVFIRSYENAIENEKHYVILVLIVPCFVTAKM